MKKKESKNKSKLREYVEAVIIAVALALIIRGVVVQAFKIPSGSMIPTLLIGDHILVNKFIYGLEVPFSDNRFLIFRAPKRGDIIVFSFPGNEKIEECTSMGNNISSRISRAWKTNNPMQLFTSDCRDFIKRVIAVGGDTVEIKEKVVHINGRPLSEPYKVHSDSGVMPEDMGARDNFGPLKVPYNKFFVMGDNRDNSHDSRFWGLVGMDEIKGSAFIIYWSWDDMGGFLEKVRWGRIGKILD